MTDMVELGVGLLFAGMGIYSAITGEPIKIGRAFQRRGPWHTPGPRQQIVLRLLIAAIGTVLTFDSSTRMLGHR
jgi:hypothetical protein